MKNHHTIVAAAAIVMLGNLVSRLLGVVREQVIASQFGATAVTSSFVAASTVPTMVYDLLIGGAISAALVPVFSEYAAVGKTDDLRQAAGTVMSLVALLLAGAALVLALLAEPLVSLLVPGLEPSVQHETVSLLRLALPAVVFLGVSGVSTALLNSRQVFSYPAFSVAMYNLGIIVAALAFAGRFGVTSLVLGVLLGASLHLGLQLPGLRRTWPAFSLHLRHPAVARILWLYGPVALGLVVSQVGVVIDRNLASRTGDDSLAVLRFATTLVQFPVGIVVTATVTAVLPTLSRYAALGATVNAVGPQSVGPGGGEGSTPDAYMQTLAGGLRMVLLAILPTTLAMIMLREPLVRLLFERGAFDAQATQRTALAFLFYAPQLPFVAADLLLISAFYARQNTRTPTLVGVLGVLVFLGAGVSLIQSMGMPGLALANTIQHTFHALLLLALLWRQTGGLAGYGLGLAVGQGTAASLAVGAVWWVAAPVLGAGTSSLALFLLLALVVWVSLYGTALHLLRVPEVRLLWALARARVVGGRSPRS